MLIMVLYPCVSAQESVSVFLDQNYQKTDSVNASIKRTIVFEDGRYVLKDQTPDGEMLHYGTYISFNPWVEHGMAEHYVEPGILYSYGKYELGNLAGEWVYLIGKERHVVDYDFHKHISPEEGCLTLLEEMKEQRRDDDQRIKVGNALRDFFNQEMVLPARTLDRSDGFFAYIDFIIDPSGVIRCPMVIGINDRDLVLEMERVVHRFRYPGKLRRMFKVRFSIFQEGSRVLSENDGDVIYILVEDPPAFQGDLEKFIRDNLVYPEAARQRGAYGRVVVNFVVEPDGSVSNVIAPLMVDPLLNQEAIRLIQTTRWNPGRIRGDPVRVHVNVVVPFDLGY